MTSYSCRKRTTTNDAPLEVEQKRASRREGGKVGEGEGGWIGCRAGKGRVGQGRAEQGRAGQDRTGQGRAGQGRARQGGGRMVQDVP